MALNDSRRLIVTGMTVYATLVLPTFSHAGGHHYPVVPKHAHIHAPHGSASYVGNGVVGGLAVLPPAYTGTTLVQDVPDDRLTELLANSPAIQAQAEEIIQAHGAANVAQVLNSAGISSQSFRSTTIYDSSSIPAPYYPTMPFGAAAYEPMGFGSPFAATTIAPMPLGPTNVLSQNAWRPGPSFYADLIRRLLFNRPSNPNVPYANPLDLSNRVSRLEATVSNLSVNPTVQSEFERRLAALAVFSTDNKDSSTAAEGDLQQLRELVVTHDEVLRDLISRLDTSTPLAAFGSKPALEAKLQRAINEAASAVESLNAADSAYKTANQQLADLQSKLNTAETDEAKAEIKKQIDTATKAMQDAKDTLNRAIFRYHYSEFRKVEAESELRALMASPSLVRPAEMEQITPPAPPPLPPVNY